MKRILFWLAMICSWSALAQAPLLRNSFTTNNPPKFPLLLPVPSASSNAFPVVHTDFDETILEWQGMYFSGDTNAFLRGILSAGGGKFTNSLTLNGSPVLTNAGITISQNGTNGAPAVNFTNSPTVTWSRSGSNWTATASGSGGITNSGVGTNNYLAKWTGTNSLGNSSTSDDGTNVLTELEMSTLTVRIGADNNNAGAARQLFQIGTSNESSSTNAQGVYQIGNANQFGNVSDPALAGPVFQIGRNNTSGNGIFDVLEFGINNAVTDSQSVAIGEDNIVSGRRSYAFGRSLTVSTTKTMAIGAPNSSSSGLNEVTIGVSATPEVDITGGTVTLNASVVNPNWTASTLIQADSGQTLSSIANDVGILTNDGSGGFGFTTNISQDVTYNNITTTNLTVINSLTVSNISVTNVTIQNSLTVKGKAVSFTSANGTNVNQLNLKDTASVTWAYDGTSNVTATATASGGGVTTAVTALAYSGTNITGFNCLTNNATYTLLLTNHCLFDSTTFTGLPNTTTNMFFTLGLQQNSAGGWVPKLTNSIVAWADGVQPVIKTNANAVSYLYFHTHLFTNGMLVGSPNINVQ